jgi:hypothetical protein
MIAIAAGKLGRRWEADEEPMIREPGSKLWERLQNASAIVGLLSFALQ